MATVYNNIYATIGSTIPTSSSPTIVRTYWRRVLFSEFETVLPYKPGEFTSTSFYPEGIERALFFVPVLNCGVTKPSFVTTEAWEELEKTSSGFMSGNRSIMPRIVFPSSQLCNNGLNHSTLGQAVDSTTYAQTFNWDVYKKDGTAETLVVDADLPGYAWREHTKDAYGYVSSLLSKSYDSVTDLESHTLLLKLTQPATVPAPITNFDSTNLVGGGDGGAACAFVIKLEKLFAYQDTLANDNAFQSKLVLSMGSGITMVIDAETGNMLVDVNGQPTRAALVKTETTQKPGQATIAGSYVLLAYPAWNGIVASGGVQDSQSLVDTASTFCVKNKNADISFYQDPAIEDFDFDDPGDTEIDYDVATSVRTDWGDYVKAAFLGCNGVLSYTPAFFMTTMKFVVYFVSNENTTDATYQYHAWPIYSKNGVGATDITIHNSNEALIVAGSGSGGIIYRKFQWTVDSTTSGEWKRRGPEIFGYTSRIKETTNIDISNSNGTFNLTKSGGAVNLGTSWSNYIQSISVTTGVEGTTGTITLDKYAMRGQTDYPPQSIGAITIDIGGGITPAADSPYTTGRIFTGLGYGVSDNTSEGSDTWTIQLYGLEKKLEEIRLVNAPFWDGDTVKSAGDFLGGYGGLSLDWSNGSTTFVLPRSNDFESPAINFAIGTPVIEALNTIAEEGLHVFTIQKDGKGYFYKADNDYALPDAVIGGSTTLHTYDSTIAISRDNTPSFEHLFNVFATAGLETAGTGAARTLATSTVPAVFFDTVTNTKPSVPWSKMFVYTEQGVFPHATLQTEHNRNMKRFGRSYLTTGSITIPGDASVKLYDRLSVDGTTWFVHSVSHDVNFSSKEWTTSLSVSVIP